MLERKTIEVQYLRRRVDYDHLTGNFFWRKLLPDDPLSLAAQDELKRRKWNCRYAGKQTFNNLSAQGYLRGCINYVKLYSHRAAWAHVHGEWPDVLDHINRDRADNRIENLRPSSASLNAINQGMSGRNKSGHTGILVLEGRPFPYRAHARVNGVVVIQKQFATLDEAIAAREAAVSSALYQLSTGKDYEIDFRGVGA